MTFNALAALHYNVSCNMLLSETLVVLPQEDL